MTPERWQRVEEIFQAAIDLKLEERPAFVESACAGNEELRREVDSLITADEQGLSFVDEPALEVAADLLATGEPELAEGQSFGHYEIVGLIGRGGMGEVYLAIDKLLNRQVALKLLPADYTRDRDRLRRFQQEAQAASVLNHPNILTIYALGQVEGQQFIATEFVEGETLRQRMKRGGLSIGDVLDIAVQIAGALAVAHRAGIIHRDIKPENIMLRTDGYVKVLDFGLAKLTEQSGQDPDARLADNPDISSGLVMGTVKYMSPEQARGLAVDPRSDIFSLGVVLYEMLTRRAPFNGETTGDLIKSILKDEPPPLTEYLPDSPEGLTRIVANALSKDKARRYQTVEELHVDLKNLKPQFEPGSGFQRQLTKLDGRAVSTEDQRPERTSTIEYLISQIREHKHIAAVLLGLIVLLGGIGYQLRKWVSKRAVAVKELKTTFLTTTGRAMDPAISPDGKYVAYRKEDGGLVSLCIKEIGLNNETQITPPGKRFVFAPIFSPDGKYLYYETIGDDPPPDSPPGLNKHFWRQLYRAPISGGSAERIVNYLTSKITFSPDGQEQAFIRLNFKERVDQLVTANVDGTNERSIIARKAPNYFQTDFYGAGPSWAPDGKRIAYVARDASDGYDRIFEVNLETKVERPLTSQKWGGIGDVNWLPDSSGLLFGAAHTSLSGAIWRLTYPSCELQRITNDANKYMGMSVASDSNTLVTTQAADYIDLWIAPDADASLARRIMAGRHDGRYGFAWTHDGRVVYSRETSDNSDIWIANADGTTQRQLTTDVHQDVDPAVTNDGRYIVFQSNRSDGDHIWRMDIDGNDPKQLTFGAVERQPSCSPDSKWVVYTAWESGKPTPWKIPIEGGAPQQIADVECGRPRISHNGKLIGCLFGRRVLILSFEGGQPVAALELPQGAWWDGSWTLDDRAIRYAINDFEASWGIYGTFNWWIQPIDGGPSRQLTFFTTDQPGATSKPASAWSSDGKDLLYSRFEIKSDVIIMSGFK